MTEAAPPTADAVSRLDSGVRAACPASGRRAPSALPSTSCAPRGAGEGRSPRPSYRSSRDQPLLQSAAMSPSPTPAPSAATPSATAPRSASWSSRRTFWRWSTRGVYKGLYHVLHGAISPTEGVGADDISIRELLARLRTARRERGHPGDQHQPGGRADGHVPEPVITPLGIKVTRLARGLPFGTELEYADDVTLTRAFEGKRGALGGRGSVIARNVA